MNFDLPTTLLRRVQRRLVAASAFSTSPFTGSQQVQDWGGRWWAYEIEFSVSQGAAARRLSIVLDALYGGVNTFTLRDPSIVNLSGLGSPRVNGGGQSGNTLITDGWTGGGLRAGDFFSLGSLDAERLYRVTVDAVPSGGAAAVNFIPPLRSVPADNAPLNVVNPGVVLRPQGVIPTDIGRVDKHEFTITAREAL